MLEKKYLHNKVEEGKHDFWVKNDLFKADPKSKKDAFTIVIPPPNVTGKLHLGHAWDTTIQDILIRNKKMNGYETLWLPGMDHAAIATEAKVVARIKEELGISKYDLTREEFLKHAWNWKDEYAKNIREQWSKLGLSLDYSKERFTLDEGLNKSVNRVFTSLFNKGLIYKGEKIINWDTHLNTALSNIEVEYENRIGKFYHLKYFIKDTNEFIEVATTRPETCFADAAVAVNPKDEKMSKYIGMTVINPVNGEELNVISDNYVEIGFGTGALKVTPAHDPNDYNIGKRHNLEFKVCMNFDGTMNENALWLNGINRDEARELLMERLVQEDKVVVIKDHEQNVGTSQRSGVVVEPMLSEQWFIKMDHFVDIVNKLQEDEDEKVNILPKRFEKNFNFWLDNMEDWCISRQIWWGHQIPAWYHNQTGEVYVGEEEPKDIENWTRDEDTLDTWFSSALWPFSTLNWDQDEQSELMNKFYPNSVLVTGHDILFFWVARMMFMASEFTGKMPFKDVILHGLIRDESNRKMSKSLGNGVDPMDTIEEYGTDALRFFLTTNVDSGQDLRYEPEKLKASWNFVNKIWNSTNFVLMNLKDFNFNDINMNQEFDFEEKWILSRFNSMLSRVNNAFETYEFTVFGKEIYNFIKFEYCDWYIEIAKVKLNDDKDNKVKSVLLYILDNCIKVLHPFMPFVTEEIYQEINGKEKSIMLENWPSYNEELVNLELEKEFKYIENITTIIRSVRLEQKLGNKKVLDVVFNKNKFNSATLEVLKNMNNINLVSTINNGTKFSYLDFDFEINLEGLIDNTELISKLEKEITKLESGLKAIESKLGNEKFVSNAPVQVVESEKKRFDLLKSELDSKKDSLNKLV